MNASCNQESTANGDWVINKMPVPLSKALFQHQSASRIRVFWMTSAQKGDHGHDNA